MAFSSGPARSGCLISYHGYLWPASLTLRQPKPWRLRGLLLHAQGSALARRSVQGGEQDPWAPALPVPCAGAPGPSQDRDVGSFLQLPLVV